MKHLYNLLFGCWHKNFSFPLSIRGGKRCPTYQVCLDCGKEFTYSWKQMKRGEAIEVAA